MIPNKILVKVKTNCKKQEISKLADGSYFIQLKNSPKENAANAELISLLSDELNIPKSYIMIKSGVKSKIKLIEISNGEK